MILIFEALQRPAGLFETVGGSMYGAVVAVSNLLQCLGEVLSDLECWIIGDCDCSGNSDKCRLRIYLESLPLSIRRRSRCVSTLDLMALACDAHAIVLTDVPAAPAIIEWRAYLKLQHIPMCVLVHSVVSQQSAAIYSYLRSQMLPWDKLVAPSRASYLAVKSLLTDTIESSDYERKSDQVELHPYPVRDYSNELLSKENARLALQLPRDSFILLSLGRLSRVHKADLSGALWTVQQLTAKGTLCNFICAGQALNESDALCVSAQARAYGIQHRLTLFPNFPEIVKPLLLSAADVLIAPSDSIQESFGLSLIEAMSAGLPLIASDWSGFRDIVVHGHNGYLIETTVDWELAKCAYRTPLRNPISLSAALASATVVSPRKILEAAMLLATDIDLRIAMGRASRADYVERFSNATLADRYHGLFLRMLRDRLAQEGWNQECPSPLAPFSSFPTRPIDSDDYLFLNASSLILNDLLAIKEEGPDVEREIIDLMEMLHNSDMRILEVVERGISRRAILWLLKKGLCELRRVEPRPSSSAVGGVRQQSSDGYWEN